MLLCAYGGRESVMRGWKEDAGDYMQRPARCSDASITCTSSCVESSRVDIWNAEEETLCLPSHCIPDCREETWVENSSSNTACRV